jgi:hypothetical protein
LKGGPGGGGGELGGVLKILTDSFILQCQDASVMIFFTQPALRCSKKRIGGGLEEEEGGGGGLGGICLFGGVILL